MRWKFSIPPPDGLTFGQRFLLTITIALVILFALALFGYFSGGWEAEGEESQLYSGIPLDAHLLPIDRIALEEAYRQHLIRLWNVWLTDGAKDASRIKTGLKIARQAYHQASQELDKREQQLRH